MPDACRPCEFLVTWSLLCKDPLRSNWYPAECKRMERSRLWYSNTSGRNCLFRTTSLGLGPLYCLYQGGVVSKLSGLAYWSNTPALITTISGPDCIFDRLIQHGLYCAELTATLSVLAGRQAGTPGMLDSVETWETSVKSTA